jgi:hypothetical protein
VDSVFCASIAADGWAASAPNARTEERLRFPRAEGLEQAGRFETPPGDRPREQARTGFERVKAGGRQPFFPAVNLGLRQPEFKPLVRAEGVNASDFVRAWARLDPALFIVRTKQEPCQEKTLLRGLKPLDRPRFLAQSPLGSGT